MRPPSDGQNAALTHGFRRDTLGLYTGSPSVASSSRFNLQAIDRRAWPPTPPPATSAASRARSRSTGSCRSTTPRRSRRRPQPAGVTFVEQLLTSKRMTRAAARGVRLARVRRAAARPRGVRRSTSSARPRRHEDRPTRRVLPLHKRGNRLFVAISDPANLQALEEVRFKTNLVVEPIVVEDDKLARGDRASVVEASERYAQGAGRARGPRGRACEDETQTPRSRPTTTRGRGRAGRQVHPEDPARRDQRRRLRHPLRALREVLPHPLPHRRRS